MVVLAGARRDSEQGKGTDTVDDGRFADGEICIDLRVRPLPISTFERRALLVPVIWRRVEIVRRVGVCGARTHESLLLSLEEISAASVRCGRCAG